MVKNVCQFPYFLFHAFRKLYRHFVCFSKVAHHKAFECYVRYLHSVPASTPIKQTVDGFMFISRSRCNKFFFSRRAFRQEQYRYRKFYRAHPNLANFCAPIEYHERIIASSFTCPEYKVLSKASAINAAVFLLGSFRALGLSRQITLVDLPEIVSGLACIERLHGGIRADNFQRHLARILKHNFYVGPCHGDFHAGNIMESADHVPVLIDFDCCRVCSIQAIDALYYIIQSLSDERSISWHAAAHAYMVEGLDSKSRFLPLEKFFDGNLLDLQLLHFVDRIGQDDRFITIRHPSKEAEYFLDQMLRFQAGA